MTSSARDFDALINPLVEYASHLAKISESNNEPPFYEMMSGALVWHDETDQSTPTEVIWSLRVLWAYRTSLMLEQPRTEFEEVWSRCMELFPSWVGFLPERRSKTDELMRIYRKGDVNLRKCLRDSETSGDA